MRGRGYGSTVTTLILCGPWKIRMQPLKKKKRRRNYNFSWTHQRAEVTAQTTDLKSKRKHAPSRRKITELEKAQRTNSIRGTESMLLEKGIRKGGWEELVLVERINRGKSGIVDRIISSVRCHREIIMGFRKDSTVLAIQMSLVILKRIFAA